jgi:hypothetical protein
MNNFTIFYKSGGGDSIKIVDDYWKKITSVFKELSKKEYSQNIEHFHIALRVDGEYLTFGDKEGCNNLRLFKKKSLISNSIFFGEEIYLNKDILENFIKGNLIKAFEQFIKRLEKEKMEVTGESLINDLNRYMSEYL